MVHLADPQDGPWKIQVVGAAIDLLFGAVMLFAYGFALQNIEFSVISLDEFLKERFAPLITESLVAISRVLLWTLLFIIPGVIFYVLYIFLPYIVFFNPKYAAGELNALEESKRVVKPHFFKIFAFVLITGLISLALELASKVLGFTHWWQEIWFSLAAFYFSGYTFMLFFGLYKYYEEKNESWKNS